MPIGAHVGVAGGYAAAVDYAAEVGCECLQVFAKSPRRWEARPFDERVADAFRERVEATGMQGVLVHTAYLINLGTADATLWERSWRALADELTRASLLGATAVVTHLGTLNAEVPERTAARIADAIDRAWDLAGSDHLRLLLENTAGAGTTFGSGPAELGAVLHQLGDAARHTGVCLDTCHAHAAGWDLSRPSTWEGLRAEFQACCGMPIEAVHANDCLFPPGEHKDRHAWIGDGTIGEAGFAAMFADARLRDLPVVVEMPGEVPVKDAENVSRLKRLRDASVARA
jgi:deoxyribonuclease-4